jgi:hypothetical protein
MSVEQVARDFITSMNDLKKIQSMLTADAMASGGVLPQAMPVLEAFNVTCLRLFPILKLMCNRLR